MGELFVMKVTTSTGSSKYLVISVENNGDLVVIERFNDELEALATVEFLERKGHW